MAEKTRSLLETAPASALGEGAARFDRLIESVKASQSSVPAPTTPAVIQNPLFQTSPGEEWSRQFQSQSFGPELKSLSLSDLAPVPRALLMPDDLSSLAPGRNGDFAAPRSAEIATRPPPLGAGIGKPEKARRSWLGRMFGRA
jgi:hypothetical protein